MNWRCLFGHSLHRVAPLYSKCVRCEQGFFTDYFASHALGRPVRIKVDKAELQRATGEGVRK
jgi:hypothetical protein